MYSVERVHTRFAEHAPNSNNADHFICVTYDDGWVYDNNVGYYPFEPEVTDILVAAVDFANDTITLLVGVDGYEYGIVKGYASGDLSFTSNMWNGSYNPGEFGITGSQFTPNDSVVKTYRLGGQRVAQRHNDTLFYLHSDHLGSASLTTDAGGGVVSEMRYYPYGATRRGTMPTDRRFTGQREAVGLGGLYDYGARYYDAATGRFVSADTIVPDFSNPQSLNRYAYVLGNPLRYTDPSGHHPALLGAGLGFIAGAIGYSITTSSWHVGECAMVAVTGAGAGALIGDGCWCGCWC
jgi:RHS repeat-associated protein